MLIPLLAIAAKRADSPDLEAEKFSGPKNSLPATAILLTTGRTDTEASIRIRVGKIEFAFLIAFDDVMSAVGRFTELIDPASGTAAH